MCSLYYKSVKEIYVIIRNRVRNVMILSITKTVVFLFFKCVVSEKVEYHQVIRLSHEISCPEIANELHCNVSFLAQNSTEEPC